MSTVNRRTFLKTGAVSAAGLSLCGRHAVVRAQQPKPAQPPQVDDRPLLRLEAGGPTTFVTSLAFSSDGQTLYAAGFDKVVRVWKLQDGRFTLDKVSYRVPIGPGLNGSINAIALSPDGGLLAAAGRGVMRGEAGFRQEGMVVPQIGGLTSEMRADLGTIFLFDTRAGTMRRLRGHLGPVEAMAVAPAREGKPAILVSAAKEWDGKQYAGAIRVWNATDGKEIDSLGQQPNYAGRPGLIVWHTGDELKQLRVVSVWDDGKIRLWDVGQDQFTTADDGKYNLGLGYLPGQGKVVSGSITGTPRGNVGHVRLWDGRSGAEFRMDSREANFPPEDGGSFYPRALTLLSLEPGRAPDHAAVVFRVPEKGDRYDLQIIDLTPGNFGQVRARLPLWTGGENIPVLAFAPRGAHLAVAGNDQHEIKVFPIMELTNREPKFQALKSSGTNFRGIAFVKKNNDLALALRPQAADAAAPGADATRLAELKAGDLIFDFTRRSLLDDQTGWRIDAPEGGEWQASVVDLEKNARGRAIRQAVVLRQGGQERRRITLKQLYEVTSLAVLSPRGPATVPILALAFLDDHKQPYLFLYNAETGEQVRQYTGHTDPIRSLAFSSDGRLLGSAADDQTVCVWSLTSLPKHIGQRGLIPGLAIKDEDGKLVIGKVDQDSPAGTKVETGDIVEGLVENNEVRKLKSSVDFYEAVSQRKPGQQVTIQVAGKGAVAIPVGQYIDQLNALLFLFITAAEKLATREWIGWNPDGQFDASDRKTERLIGWHFNKGKDENSPPAFAFAEQYRKEFFREGILKFLVATGSLSQALKAWEKEDKAKELPKPKMVFWIDEAPAAGQEAKAVVGPDPKKIDDQGRLIVQKREATLRLNVYDFPSSKIDLVSWGLKGEKLQPFAKSLGQEYSADLAPVLTAPGEYKIRLVLRSEEQEAPEYTRDLTVRFQQAAAPAKRDPTKPLPKLVLTKPAPGATFYEEESKANPEVELQGTLDLPDDRKFDAVVMIHDADGKDELKVAPVVKGETLTAKVPLKYRNSRIEVLLSNEGNDPTVAAEMQLRYLRPPRILSVDAPKESAKPLADVAARVYSPLEVTRDQVEAEVNGRDLARERIQLEKGDGNTWKIDLKDVPLDPAKNVVHLYVSNGEARSRQPGTATINFQPPNPGPLVEFLSPPMDTKVTDPELDLRFRVKSAGPLQRVEFVREGKNAIRRTFDLANQQPNAQGYYVFDEKAFPKELKDFPLEAKENILRVEAVNSGGTQYASVVVNYINVPVTLTIDKIVPWDPETLKSGQAIVPKIRMDGGLMVDRSPQGRVKVVGQVTWSKANDAQLKKAGQVRVFVNGFQQIPGTFDEPKGKERRRTFTADLVLNRPEGNFVEMDLPDIKQDASNRTEFTLGSLKPIKGQRLHLLIVGVGEKDEKKLYNQAITALRATTDSQGRSSSPAFEDVHFYGPLTGFVSPEQVYTQLCLIKKTIDLHAPQGSVNDVVMVYYQGQETVDGKGHFFRTSASKFDPELHRSAITCDGLSSYFTETLGAQILLLDVIRTAPPVSLAPGEATDRISKWPDSSYTGVMRYLKRIDKGGAPQDILMADLSDVMPKATESGKAMEWGDVLAKVQGKITNDGTLVLDEKCRTPLKKLIVG
jgi:WD40 repeat protein